MSDTSEGERLNSEALKIARELNKDMAVAVILNNMADWKIIEGKYESALELRQEMLQLTKRLNDKAGTARALVGECGCISTALLNLAKEWQRYIP